MHLTTMELLAAAADKLGPRPPFAGAVCGAAPVMRDLTTERAHVTCPHCLAAVDSTAPQALVTNEQPLTTWRAIADAIGVSEDTLLRRRKAHGVEIDAYFADASAARAWYAQLLAPARPEVDERKLPRASRPRRPAPAKATGTRGTTLADLKKTKGTK